ncbi:MAG TPA: YbjQ family protein [Acidiphilium sp.]|nr:MAG: hypothetical protein B7Z67_13275 [Acidiphilium sp. 21-60-14]OYV89703.1 MAG: hypothetical protein B7Z57_11830 [Acidiphilium sp. 37-60-79]OZB38001.1 MAG: hypothetical protein B7X48_14730 [Acidiphilium sp. 34-60-192]HQT89563.1 YbjQ family protein [Acidiphilium sp.]HQU25008.1 YbjQ family protein [Acidiphilium sp.]
MIIVTTNEIRHREIKEIVGPVYGTAIRSRNLFGLIFGILRSLFGGSQVGFIKMTNRTRDQAIKALEDHAEQLGCSAVLAMRFDTSEVMGKMTEITAYGTGVILEPKSQKDKI